MTKNGQVRDELKIPYLDGTTGDRLGHVFCPPSISSANSPSFSIGEDFFKLHFKPSLMSTGPEKLE